MIKRLANSVCNDGLEVRATILAIPFLTNVVIYECLNIVLLTGKRKKSPI